MKQTEENIYTIAAVEKAFEVLEYVARHSHDVSAIEIHSHTGIAKPTLHKTLQTLRALGYIEQNPETTHYYPTMKMLQVAYYTLNRHDFFMTYYPYVQMYMRRFCCPTSLVTYSGSDPVIVYSSVGTSNVIVDRTRVTGSTMPLYASSSGRLFLAELEEEEARKLLSDVPLTPMTGTTLCTVEEILAFVQDVKKKGYCRIDGEVYYGFTNFAFPLRDMQDRLVGSLNLVIPQDRLEKLMTEEAVQEVLTTLGKIRLPVA